MSELKKSRFVIQRSGRALRSGSLFAQPIVEGLYNLLVGDEEPTSLIDETILEDFTFFGVNLFVNTSAGWRGASFTAATAPPPQVETPVPAEAADHESAPDTSLTEYERTNEVLYFAPTLADSWVGIPLIPNVVPLSGSMIAFMDGEPMLGMDGAGLSYLPVFPTLIDGEIALFDGDYLLYNSNGNLPDA